METDATKSLVYCDTSLVIDYLLAAGREPESQDVPPIYQESDFELEKKEYWKKLFRHDKRYQFAIRLRSIVGWSYPKARVVVSPFVLLELDEWYAEETFKRNALEGTHVKAVQSYSRKEIGEFIQQVVRDSDGKPDGFANMMWASMASGARGEALAGIEIQSVDRLRFGSDAFAKVSLLSHLQLGMADIVHLLAAEAIKCTHFATTDSDFNRLRQEIEKSFRFKILYKDEVFGVVKAESTPHFR